MRALKVCSTQGCTRIAGPGERYCVACIRAQQKADRQKRGTSYKKYYNRPEWKRVRKEHLRIEPYCVDCGRVATDVDHIVPVSQGGSDDHTNLESRCHSCHSRKTATHDGGFGNRVTEKPGTGEGA